MEKLSLKAYAVKNKMSLFSVVKLVKSGKVKSSTEEVDGKDVTYVLLEDEVNNSSVKSDTKEVENLPFDIEKELKKLMIEVASLKEEIEKLKK